MPPASSITEFTKRAKSILWRQESGAEKDRKTYAKWQARVAELKSEAGLNKHQAAVQASKDFQCLWPLFRMYDLKEHDPHPDSHPNIQHFGQPVPEGGQVKIENKEQSHRDNLCWAIEAAGEFLNTGKQPASCPNSAAYYLYRQACDEPRDFLGKFNQVEIKGGDEQEAKRRTRKTGQRAIDEINEMLAEIDGASPDAEENDDE